MFKRLSAVLVAIAMLLSMLCTFSVALAEGELPQLALSADDEDLRVERGDTLNLLVSVKNYTPAVAIQISGTHEKDVLLATQVKGSYEVAITPTVTVPVNYVISNEPNSLLQFVPAVKPENNDVAAIWADTVAIPVIENFCMVVYEVKEDAPFGKTTLEFGFDYYSVGENLDLTPGEDYVTKTTLDLEIYCEHDFTDVAYTKPAEGTSMEAAEHSRVCTKCDQTITEACAFDTVVVTPPTHTEGGYTTNTCVCGYAVMTDPVEAEGHDWGAYSHDAELNADSKHTHTATCTADDGGVDTQLCVFGEAYTDPTCTEDGYTTYTCATCTYTYDVTDEGSATGHNLEEKTYLGIEQDQHRLDCTECDYSETEDCVYGAWGVTTEPTRTETGLKKRTCSVCAGVDEEVLPKIAYFALETGAGDIVAGSEMTVEVKLINNPGTSGMVFDLDYDDEVLTLIGAEAGDIVGEGGQIVWSEDAPFRVAFAGAIDAEGDGTILRLTFAVNEDTAAGDYDIAVSTADATDKNEAQYDVETVTESVTILDYLWGDANNDKKTNIHDALLIMRYLVDLVEEDALNMTAANADRDTDGVVNIHDALLIMRYLVDLVEWDPYGTTTEPPTQG